jgi:uncharacterized protein with HEPN domain
VYLLHILDCIQRIADYTQSGKDEFMQDPRTQDAVARNLEIIGEAAKLISAECKDLHPGVPWRQMAGMRDRLIHQYFRISLHLVWAAVETELEGIRAAVTRALEQLDEKTKS